MLFRLIKRYARPHLWIIALILVLQIVQSAASLWLPALNADIIDKGVVVGNTGAIWKYGLLMLGMTVIQVAANLSAIYFGSRVGTLISKDIRRDTFANVQTFSRAEIHDFEAASLITRATNDVQTLQMVIILTLIEMIMAPLIGVGAIIMAIRQDLGLSILLMVVVPLLGFAMALIMWRLQRHFQRVQRRTDRINAILREQLSGARVIRAFVRQVAERNRFQKRSNRLLRAKKDLSFLFALMFPTMNVLSGIASVGVIGFGAIRIQSGATEVGSMIAFLNYLMQVFFAVMIMSFVFMMIPRGRVAAERITEVLDTRSSISSPASPLPLGTGKNQRPIFVYEDVSVQYPGAEVAVLCDINVTLRPGQTTAVIGSTGSGKSTLATLLPRLHDPSAGRITVNGNDLREVDLDELRSRIAYVPQTAYLFSGTIASTVSGVPVAQITDEVRERVRAALKIAQAEDFVYRLDEGVDAKVATGGKNFSGGQKQRLTIARALYREADLYVFDDSFSALDYATEARLRAGLENILHGAAVLMVAQRVSTISGADNILVLDKGRIVGQGKHEDLLQNCPTYQEIVDSQIDHNGEAVA